jgi:hypothetical protein
MKILNTIGTAISKDPEHAPQINDMLTKRKLRFHGTCAESVEPQARARNDIIIGWRLTCHCLDMQHYI